jgi:hypothetical protein
MTLPDEESIPLYLDDGCTLQDDPLNLEYRLRWSTLEFKSPQVARLRAELSTEPITDSPVFAQAHYDLRLLCGEAVFHAELDWLEPTLTVATRKADGRSRIVVSVAPTERSTRAQHALEVMIIAPKCSPVFVVLDRDDPCAEFEQDYDHEILARSVIRLSIV